MSETLDTEAFQRLSISLWAIWSDGRKALHEGIFQSPHAINGFINSYLAELRSLETSPRTGTSRAQPAAKIWVPPPENHAKVNVDAAVSRSGRHGAVAAISRSGFGTFQGASMVVFPTVIDPATLEAMAIREGIALSMDLNNQNVHIASDCKNVVQEIKEGSRSSYGAIIHEISLGLNAFISCNIVYESRSSNFEAHNLAKHALHLGPGRHVWLAHPGNLLSVPVNVVTN